LKRGFSVAYCIFVVVLALSCIEKSWAQENYFFEHISLEQGLSQGSGYAVAQHDGYLWMGTQDGLNRYDGYSFKVFRSGDSNSVNDNFIQTFLKDSENRFWVATGKGICLYDKSKENFKTFDKYFHINSILSKISIRHLLEDKQKNIWIISDENGVFCFNPKSKSLKRFFEKANNFLQLEETADAKLYLLSDADIFLYDFKTHVFKAQEIKKKLNINTKNVLRAMVSDQHADLWLGTYENGVYVLSTSGKPIRHFSKGVGDKGLSSNEIKCFLRDSKNRIWIGSRNGGLTIYNPETEKFIKIKNYKTEPKSLGKNYVLSLFEDLQANIWVGLSGGGFDKYDPRKYRFQIIEQNEANAPNALSDNMVFKIIGEDRYLYFGTQAGGLNRMDTATKTFKVYKPKTNDPNSILHSEVYDISVDKNKNLWLATGRGLCQFIPASQTFKSYLRQDTEPSLYLYSARVLRQQKEIWAGGQRGLFRFDLNQKKWKDWADLLEIKNISKFVIRIIFEDSQQNIWIGTLGHGLIKYNPSTKKIKIFDEKNALKCANIRCIYEDNNTLWIGTDCGLFKLNLKKNEIEKHYSTQNGLVNNVIYGVLTDAEGKLWLSSNRGLMKYDLEKGLLKSFQQKEGLSSNEFNSNCTYKKADGSLYFGSVGGVTYFNPQNLYAYTFSPPARITRIKVQDSLYSPLSKSLRLSYSQNFIDLEFSTFNFSNTESNSYLHRLEGIEDKWVENGNNHSTRYTNLPPGDYVFKLKSKNADGVENPQETHLKINIEPPFWKTKWFRILLLSGILLGVYGVFIKRIKQIRKEEARKTELLHIRSQAEMIAMKAQINPHFIFNCLNTVDAYILSNQRKEASRFLQVFSKLIRMVLENSSEEYVPLKQDFQALKLYISLEEERFEHSFSTIYHIDPKLLDSDYQVPPLLLQPFVENAILHGLRHRNEAGGILEISLKSENEFLEITIKDNGIGRIASAEINKTKTIIHKSKGLDLTVQRITALGELLDQPSDYQVFDLNEGTQIYIKIPLIK
jgi:ligand-binding sensor domain-containing protein